MFDFAWSEIAIIAAVAVVVIGPKDLPVAIRTVTSLIKKARSMASEFQTHVDEMVREANLDEVRNQISEIRNFDIKSEIEKAVDPDHALRDTFASNPLEPDSAALPTVDEVEVAEHGTATPEPPEPAQPLAPAFIPPHLVPPPAVAAKAAEPPAFIPPAFTASRPG
jgi:sec-independent protein translocase protein TatB